MKLTGLHLTGAGTVKAEKADSGLPKLKIVANTGNPMRVRGYAEPVIIDLAGVKLRQKTTPVIMDHDPTRRVGHSISVNKEGVLTLDGLVSSTSTDAKEFLADSKNGFPFQSSVGADVLRGVKLAEGKTAIVNGKTVTGPMIIARETLLNEVSITTLGADHRTSAIAASRKRAEMKKKKSTKAKAKSTSTAVLDIEKEDLLEIEGFGDYLERLELSLDTLTDEAAMAIYSTFEASQEADTEDEDDDETPPPRKTKKTVKKPVKASKTDDDDEDEEETDEDEDGIQASNTRRALNFRRIAGIEACVEKLKKEGFEVPASIIAAAIENEKMSPTKFELNARRKGRSTVAIHTSSSDVKPSDANIIEAALLLQNNIDEEFVGSQFDEKTVNAAMGKAYRGLSLHYLIDMNIRASGGHFNGSRKSNDYIRAGLAAMREIQATGYSTLSVPNILENVGNKMMIASYEAQETAWQEICSIKQLNDFKIHSSYRLDASGSYRKVGADGELKSISLTDAKYTMQGDTFGAIISLNRQQIINDDMSAFSEIPIKLGMMAALRLEEAVFVLLLSNPGSFFSVGNKNLVTGGPSLSIASLTVAERRYLDRVDANGKPILIRPEILLHGTQDSVVAAQLYVETKVERGGGNTSTAQQFTSNPHAGKFRPVVSPYLNNTSITDENGAALSGQSATQYYLLGDPKKRAAISVGFLNGNRIPVLESNDLSFDKLGISWRSFHDWGVGMEDPAAAVRDAGV